MQTAPGSRKPSDSAFKQQKLKAWQPILTSKWVISSFTVIGAVFIPIGIAIMMASRGVVEVTVPYGKSCQAQFTATYGPNIPYRNQSAMAPQFCKLSFVLTDSADWETKDVYVYYQLDNFYQNHRR